jgi:hypothetical protein
MKIKLPTKSIAVIGSFSLLLFAFNLTSCTPETTPGLTAQDKIMNAYTASSATNESTETKSANLQYYIDGTNAAVAIGTCSDTAVTVPSTYVIGTTTYSVVGVMEEGFEGSSITSISLPTTITMIGSAAFKNSALLKFSIPYLVTTINPSTFLDCSSLYSVEFATNGTTLSSVSSINEYAFAGCGKLATFYLPSFCSRVGKSAFQSDYSLTFLSFSKRCKDPSDDTKTIIDIGSHAFDGCSALTQIFIGAADTITIGDYAFQNLPDGATGYFESTRPTALASDGTWNYLSSTTYLTVLENQGEFIYDSGFFYATDNQYDASKPDGYGDDVYISKYNGSTSSDTARALTISPIYKDQDNVLHRIIGVGASVFSGHTEFSSLVFASTFDFGSGEVAVDNNIRYLDDYCFAYCSKLASINFQKAVSLIRIGVDAFRAENYVCTSLEFPASLETIDTEAFFRWRGLQQMSFDGTNAEDNTQDTAHLLTLGSHAFKLNADNVKGTCDLVLPKTLTKIVQYCFEECHFLRSITFTEPTDTTTKLTIEEGAFYHAYYISSFNLPTNTTSLGYRFLGTLDEKGSSTWLDWNLDTIHSLFLSSGISSAGISLMQRNCRTAYYSDASSRGSWNAGFMNVLNSSKANEGYENRNLDFIDVSNKTWPLNSPVYWNVAKPIIDVPSGTVTGATVLTTSRNHFHYYDDSYGDFDFVEESAGSTNLILTRFNYAGDDTRVDSTAKKILTPKVPKTLSINGATYTVTQIGDSAFFNSYYKDGNTTSGITKVTLPDSITAIGEWAFAKCTSLSEIDYYDGTTSGTPVTYSLPESTTKIGRCAFGFDAFTTMTIPGTLTQYGESDSLNADPFFENTNLTSVVIDGVDAYSFSNGLLLSGSGTNIYSSANGHAFGALTINDVSITSIGAQAFIKNSSITSCDLTGSGITSIGEFAFYKTSGMTSFKGNSALQTIGNYSFASCYPYVSQGIDKYGNDTFNSSYYSTSSLNSVDLSSCSALTTIGNSSFYGSQQLSSIDFSGCTNLTIISPYAFSNCSNLSSLDLSSCSKLKTIDQYAFKSCSSMSSLNFSGCTALETLGQYSFARCTNLSTINFSNCTGLQTIDKYAFFTCSKLGGVDLSTCTGLTTMGTRAFQYAMTSSSGDVPIIMPSASTGILTDLPERAFQGCTSATSIDLGSVTSVGKYAFTGCSGITSINWSNAQTLNDYAVNNTKLTSATFPSSLNSITSHGFGNNTDVTSIKWADDSIVTGKTLTLSSNAFDTSSALTSIVVPKGSTIKASAFNNCTLLPTTGCIYLCDTGAEYDTGRSGTARYITGWNSVATNSTANYAVYCPEQGTMDNATYKSTYQSTSGDAKYWKYNGTTPEVWTPTFSS